LNCHAKHTVAFEHKLEHYLLRASTTLKVASQVLRCFPLSQVTRIAVPPKTKMPPAKIGGGRFHEWSGVVTGGVVCGVCGLSSPLPLQHPDLPMLGCAGPPAALARVVAAGCAGVPLGVVNKGKVRSSSLPPAPVLSPSLPPAPLDLEGTAIGKATDASHRLHRVEFDKCSPLYVCMTCGAYTTSRVNKALKSSCTGGHGGPRDSGTAVLARLRAGKHPSRCAGLKDCLVRGRPTLLNNLADCTRSQSVEAVRPLAKTLALIDRVKAKASSSNSA